MIPQVPMTPRARLEAVLSRRSPDQVPWAPQLEDNFIQGMPEYWNLFSAAEQMTLRRTYRFPSVINIPGDLDFADRVIWKMTEDLGADIIGFAPSVREISDTVDVDIRQEVDQTSFVFRTPWGDLNEQVESLGIPEAIYKSRFAITERRDYDILEKVIEHRRYAPCYERWVRQQEAIGDRGVCVVRGPDIPLVTLFRVREAAQLLFDLSDMPARINALFTLIHDRNLEAFRLMAKGPGQAVYCGMAFITTQLISPTICSKYVLPHLAEYTRILHDAGKIMIGHMCGHIRRLLPILREADLDGIECLAVPPVGDSQIQDFFRLLGENSILLSGINASYIREANAQGVKDYVRKLIDDFGGKHFALRTADEIPYGTPWENLTAVSHMVHESRATTGYAH
jgi:hypothetical protein